MITNINCTNKIIIKNIINFTKILSIPPKNGLNFYTDSFHIIISFMVIIDISSFHRSMDSFKNADQNLMLRFIQ
ncbi:hypothetical protein DRF57_06055 [Chryseobacterium rhizosphaerae]|uniref:Uncharacterized protein n=1 Tax=Chryseobacterium rhizosphaerae TaxID=395937 RepID=A0ABX9IPX3_9FLAO|nr:hypothetical protein DRF57_06055 [Chryseobacterium rhizosphaerae]